MLKKALKKLLNYEMSKRILYLVALLIFALLPLVVIVSIVTGDTSSLTQYVIGSFALASVATGFYYWKAKNENLHKYKDAEDHETFQKHLLEELKKLGEDNG